MNLQIFNLNINNPEIYYDNLIKNLNSIKNNIGKKRRPGKKTTLRRGDSSNLNLIKNSSSVYNFCNKNVIKLLSIIKKDVSETLRSITLEDKELEILNYEKKDLEKFLFDEISINKKYNDNYLKLFLLIHSKYYKNTEILYFLRLLLENCESDIFIKILIYNYYLNDIYCDFGNCSSTLFSNKYYISNRKNFLNYTRPLQNDEESYYKYNYKYTCRLNEVYKCKYNYNNNYKFNFNTLYSCIFFDKFGKSSYDYEYDEEYKKNIIHIRNLAKEKYIGKVKWINENKLFKNTQIIFNNSSVKVLREYSPRKFNKQRLDIYFEINNKKIAFEYQGEQHFRSIDFFGGENAFLKRQKLDKLKKTRCKRYGIFLIEFKYDEDLSISSILNKLERNSIYMSKENICLEHLH
jgi:hypothetical protein